VESDYWTAMLLCHEETAWTKVIRRSFGSVVELIAQAEGRRCSPRLVSANRPVRVRSGSRCSGIEPASRQSTRELVSAVVGLESWRLAGIHRAAAELLRGPQAQSRFAAVE